MINPADYGLTDLEYQTILGKLGREPNHVEMGIFSAMWSEHCSYKHTRALFAQFPTQANWLLQGPGENAGVVSIDADWAVVFKVESHNHPSYVAPYDGAATGVGGLLRDVMAMGARPVGVKCLLRSGDLGSAATSRMVEQIRKGAADYSAGCGVASLGVELLTHPSFTANPLVNVLVLGLARKDALAKSGAGAPGNLLLYYGRPTGTEGVNGAAFASKGMDEKTEAHPPAGDPQAGNELMQATLELIEQSLIVGVQDMGAAGLSCSSFEMAERAGRGFTLDLDRVPVAIPGLGPDVLMNSETQERMLAAVEPGKLDRVLQVLGKYAHIQAAVVGTVNDGQEAVLTAGGQTCANLPPALVVDGFPRLTLPTQADLAGGDTPALQVVEASNQAVEIGLSAGAAPRASALNVSAVGASSDSLARISFPVIGKTVLLATACNGPEILTNPYESARGLVIRSCQALRAAGAQPLGLTDGLNFGNPDRPAVGFQVRETIRGLADGCREYGIPVVGGNVSLYNENNGASILGQVFIGVVGIK